MFATKRLCITALAGCLVGAATAGCTQRVVQVLFQAGDESPATPELRPAAELDLSQCLDTTCDSTTSAAMPLTYTESLCEVGDPLSLEVLWNERFAGPFSCPGLGECVVVDSFQLAPAPDGSLWVLAGTRRPEASGAAGGLWLAHHDRDGRRLGAGTLAFHEGGPGREAAVWGTLAVDGRGHLFVAVSESVPWPGADPNTVRNWVVEYGPDGRQVGERLKLAFGSDAGTLLSLELVPAGDKRVVLGSFQGFAMLETGVEARFVQSRAGRMGYAAIASDSQGRTSMLTLSEDGAPSGLIEHFDESGRLAWERALPWHESRAAFWSAALGVDRAGNLLQTGGWGDDTRSQGFVWLQRITPSGESLGVTLTPFPVPSERFAQLDFVSGFAITGLPLPVADHAGNVFLPWGTVLAPEKPRLGLVYEFAADGQSCRLHTWDSDMPSVERLAAGPEGELFFVAYADPVYDETGEVEPARVSYGRFR